MLPLQAQNVTQTHNHHVLSGSQFRLSEPCSRHTTASQLRRLEPGTLRLLIIFRQLPNM